MIDFADDLDAIYTDTSVIVEAPTYTEVCRKCGGSGKVTIGYTYTRQVKCFACNGAGKFERKTSPEARAKAKASRQARVERDATANWEAFVQAHPAVANYLENNAATFEFAASLRAAVVKYGSLTERQMAAAENCLAKANLRAQAATQRVAQAPVTDAKLLKDAFDVAVAKGIKRPKITISGIKFSLAPETGRNAGAIYAKDKASDTYLGKIDGGKFFASRDCTSDQSATVLGICADPKGEAIAHGKRTGSCCVCGRELTKESSIEDGIGPICASNFGW